MKLNIRLSSGVKFPAEFEGSTTLQLKTHLSIAHNCGDVPELRIVFKGKILHDSDTLEASGVKENDTVFLVTVKKKNESPPAAAAAPVAAAPPPSNPPQLQPNNDPLASPLFSNLVHSNPDLLANLMRTQMENNPALQSLMESNPMIREILSDPQSLRQMIAASSNPELRNLQQRQQDLAMSQIENLPGGFNALRSMYENIQAPLEESMVPESQASNSTSDPNNSNAGATGSAMPNPWSSNHNTGGTNDMMQQMQQLMGGAGPNADMMQQMQALMGGGATISSNNDMMQQMQALMGGGAAGSGAAALPGGMPDRAQRLAALEQLENNPMLQNLMANMDPTTMRSMMRMNPTTAQMADHFTDDQLRNMLRMSTNPTAMRSMMQMEEQMQNLGFGAAAANPWATGAPAAGGLDFTQMLGGGAALNNTTTTPQQRFARQLEQMRAMGFDDEAACIQALTRSNGNLNRAVDFLLEDN